MKILKRLKVCLILFLALTVFASTSVGLIVHAEGEISDEQKNIIIDHCDTIKDSIRAVQKVDSRTRVYLGRYFETILSNFMIPLNLRLVENSISDTKLLENQTNFAARRDKFSNNFIVYQQALEEVLNTDCKNEPVRFYEKLTVAREKRNTVNRDVNRLKTMTDEQIKLVEGLKDGLE